MQRRPCESFGEPLGAAVEEHVVFRALKDEPHQHRPVIPDRASGLEGRRFQVARLVLDVCAGTGSFLEKVVGVRKVLHVRPDECERFDHRVMEVGVDECGSDDHL